VENAAHWGCAQVIAAPPEWRVIMIVEDDSDGRAIRQLAVASGLPANLDWLPTNGIGNIKRNGDRLIGLAKERAGGHGCVAVLVDEDGSNIERDEPHRTILRICKKAKVPFVAVRQSLEAWMLADPGICEWLGVSVRARTDTIANPKAIVARAFYLRTGRAYRRRRARVEVTAHARGANRAANGSLNGALRHIESCLNQ
jgi:hypothetical protein